MSLLAFPGAVSVSVPRPRMRLDAQQTSNGPGRPTAKEFRAVLYSHDTMGLGHLRRNQLIALAITQAMPHAHVLLIAGTPQATCLELPPRVDCLTLPGFHKAADGQYGARSLGLPLDELVAMRSASICAAVEAFNPDLFIADKAPRGACGELDAALAWLRRRGKARVILGLRDILDEPKAVHRDWSLGDYLRAVQQYYDEIWVYGDRSIYDLAVEYRWRRSTSDKLRYLGYLDQGYRLTALHGREDPLLASLGLPGQSLVVCTVGGGQDGEPLASAFLRAELPDGASGVLLTGPFMSPVVRRDLERRAAGDPRRKVIDFLPEADALIVRADRLITMGGYNSVCAALSFAKPTLIVPRTVPRLEQLIRAERLERRGLVSVLTPDAATPAALSRWLADEPSPTRFPREIIDMGGLHRLAAAVCTLSPTCGAAVHG